MTHRTEVRKTDNDAEALATVDRVAFEVVEPGAQATDRDGACPAKQIAA
jgi:hypothetical protein